MTKPWYQSKTVWLGIITILIAVGNLVAEFLAKADYTPQAFVLLGVGVLIIVMRTFTDTPLTK